MKVTDDVLSVLSRAQLAGNTLVLTDALDRNLYQRTNKVLKAAGGEWKRGVGAHVFPGDAAEAVDQILLTGQVTVPHDFGFFETQPPVVARLMSLADVKPGMLALEPSAGRGAIARELAKVATVDCVDLLPANVEALKTLGVAREVFAGDFLEMAPVQIYDVVVMNPPFSRQADLLHVQHALKFVKPRGRLVSVMSAGILYRENRLSVDFRAELERRGGAIERNPDGAFKASGTMVQTVIVSMNA